MQRANTINLSLKGVAMKTSMLFLLAAFGIGQLRCQPAVSGGITFQGHLNCPAVSTDGGHLFLRLCVSGHHQREECRRPVNLCVVLDRSGSMSEESKITYAKAALYALVDQLRPDDLFSLVIYDDEVDVLRRAARVGDNKAQIRCLIDEIRPRGWTNLGGGMEEGFHQAEMNLGREYVNRVILLSDGLANQGITDPERLERIASRHRGKSISLSTIGVGLDYNENLMVGLSEGGGGNYYFLESCRNLASVFRKEFDHLSEVMTQNAVVRIIPGHGVRLIDVIGYDFRTEGGTTEISLGDLYGGEERDIIVELEVPAGRGSLALAQAQLVCPGGAKETLIGSIASNADYVPDKSAAERRTDLAEQAKVDVAVSTRNVEKAMEALDQGDRDAASQTLISAGATLLSSRAASAPGASGAAVQAQAERIQEYMKALKDKSSDARRAKKAIQYDNYRQQKNK